MSTRSYRELDISSTVQIESVIGDFSLDYKSNSLECKKYIHFFGFASDSLFRPGFILHQKLF